MIRAAGAALLLCGSAFLGFLAAGRLDARVRVIRQMLSAVQTIRRELSFSLAPVPQLLSTLEQQSKGWMRAFFTRCREELPRLNTSSLGELWSEALHQAELPVRAEELRLFASLGEVLGRYDSTGQEEYFTFLTEELERCQHSAEEERRRMGKVYRVLGVTAGGFLVVLLF